jgi:hypothetical protein
VSDVVLERPVAGTPDAAVGHAGYRQTAIFEAGGRWWAAGLLWSQVNSLGDVGRAIREDVRTRSYEKFESSTIRRRHSPTQFGLGWRLSRRGAESAAVALADEDYGRLLAGFRLPGGGCWVLAIVDGMIDPGGDTYFPPAADAAAQEHFAQLYEQLPWKHVIVGDGFPSSSLEVSYTGTDSLEALLDGLRGPPVVPIRRGWMPSGRVLMLLALLGVLGVIGWDQYDRMVLAPQRRAEAARLARERQQLTPGAPFVLDKPWERHMRVGEALRGCQELIGGMPLKAPGWRTGQWACDPERHQVTATFRVIAEEHGRPAEMRGLFERFQSGLRLNFTANGRVVGVNWTAPGQMTPRGPGGGLWPRQAIEQFVWEGALHAHEIASLTPAPAQGDVKVIGYPMTPVPAEPANLRADMQPLDFRFSTRYAPASWAPMLDAVPGFWISRVDYMVTERRWLITGTVYDAGYPAAYERAFRAVEEADRKARMTGGLVR